MTDNDLYYQRRADEELAAAKLAVDPAISQIHRHMAQLYRDKLAFDADWVEPIGGAFAESGSVPA